MTKDQAIELLDQMMNNAGATAIFMMDEDMTDDEAEDFVRNYVNYVNKKWKESEK